MIVGKIVVEFHNDGADPKIVFEGIVDPNDINHLTYALRVNYYTNYMEARRREELKAIADRGEDFAKDQAAIREKEALEAKKRIEKEDQDKRDQEAKEREEVELQKAKVLKENRELEKKRRAKLMKSKTPNEALLNMAEESIPTKIEETISNTEEEKGA